MTVVTPEPRVSWKQQEGWGKVREHRSALCLSFGMGSPTQAKDGVWRGQLRVEKEALCSLSRIPVLAETCVLCEPSTNTWGLGRNTRGEDGVISYPHSVSGSAAKQRGGILDPLLCPSHPIHGQWCQLNPQHRFRICPLVSTSPSPAPASIPPHSSPDS